MSLRVPLWDVPVRLFHWALAVCVVFSFVTGKVGGNWMQWHVKSGYCILTLVLFRLAWGVAGGYAARFVNFVRGPRAAIEYLRATWRGNHPRTPGHNPLGGWMVLFLLAILLFQVTTGLFADDEIATQGPLFPLVSSDTVERMNALHSTNSWVIAVAVALHLIAIAVYYLWLKVNLLGPMLDGGELPGNLEARSRSISMAGVLLAIAAALVYYLVVIFPRSP